MIDINPINDTDRHCLEDVYATIASFWKREYILMYACSWNFAFKPAKGMTYENFGERLSLHGVFVSVRPSKGEIDIVPRVVEQTELFQKYTGIEVKAYNFSTVGEAYDLISNETDKGNPVSIMINTYWCPWNEAYLKYHIYHYCIVKGIDKKTNDAYCVDPYLSKNEEIVNFDYLFNGMGECLTFSLTDNKTSFNWKECLVDALNRVDSSNRNRSSFNDMRLMAKEISKLEEIKKEIEGYDNLEFVPFFGILNNIKRSRNNFSKVLNYIYKENDIFEVEALSKDMLQAARQWGVVKSILIRACMVSDVKSELKRAAEAIMRIAEFEEGFVPRFKSIINKY